jgi:D-galactarolactone cycloisomerase
MPVGLLLGGQFRKKVKGYATGCYYRGENFLSAEQTKLKELAAEAKNYTDAGFEMLKVKIGLLPIKDDYKRVKAVREAVGDHIGLLVDSNHAYNSFNAVRMGRCLEDLGVLFMEEPVIPEDLDGYRKVRENLNLAIAGGECEFTRYGFKRLFEGKCVDIAQPDVCVCGGISEFQKILAIASSYGIMVMPHVWGSGIALAAALAVISAMPMMPHTANPVALQNDVTIEYDRNFNPLRDELLKNNFKLSENSVIVPEEPGLGIEIDESVLQKYCVAKVDCVAH